MPRFDMTDRLLRFGELRVGLQPPDQRHRLRHELAEEAGQPADAAQHHEVHALVDDDDVRGPASAYGAVGKENVRNALRAWIEAHPGLHYTWKNVRVEASEEEGESDFLVTFDFERRCDDPSKWGEGRETVTLDGTRLRVRKVEVHAQKPTSAKGRRGAVAPL